MIFNLPDDGTGYLPGFAALANDPCAWAVPPDHPHVEGWIDRRTPHSQVPDTYAGALYRALPRVADLMAREMASAIGNDLGPNGRVENIARLIDENVFNVSFAEFSAGDPQKKLLELIERPLLLDNLSTEPDYFPIDLAFGRIDGNLPLPIRTSQGRFVPALPVLLRLMAQAEPFVPNPYFSCFTSIEQLPVKLRYASHAGFSITQRARDDVFESVRNLLWEGAGKGPSWVSASIPADIARLYRDIGSNLQDVNRKKRLAENIRGTFFVLAVVGVGVAAQAILTEGLTAANGIKFLQAVDRIPGVDFGIGSDILKLASKFSNYGSLASDIAGEAASTAGETGMWDDYLGTWIGPEPVDAGWFGGWFDNWSFDSALSSLAQTSTSIFGNFDLQSFVTDLAKTYVQYDLAKRQLERQGQRPPAQMTRPTPGQTVHLPDGSIARTNPDGSTTVTSPSGQVRTITTTGQIVPGASGGSLIPGVPNLVLFGGAAALAAIMLMRR